MVVGPFLRGQVYMADLSRNGSGLKPWLVVSHNRRNQSLNSVLAVRITTTDKYTELDTVISIPQAESFTGYVRCDELTEVWKDELESLAGSLSPGTMLQVNAGLQAALGIE